MTEHALAGIVAIALTGVTALGAGLVAGVFFAFSSFVMRALDETDPPSSGLRAMQSINRAAVRPPFMLLFFATLLVGLAASIVLVVIGAGHAVWWAVAAEAVYLVGAVGLTIAFHVPRNDALGRLDADSLAASEAWPRYVRQWTRANHARVISALAASLLFAAAAGTVAATWSGR
jgi:uncharacterized membrane protein